MAFGLSFGSNKETNKSSTNATKNEATNQAQTGTTASSQTGKVNQSTTGASQSAGTSNTSTQNQSTTSGAGTQTQTGGTTLFGDGVLGGLEATVMKLLGAGDDPGAHAAVAHGLSSITNFNPEAFVNSSLASAAAQSGTHVDELLGGIFDAIGGRNNSAAALLGNRVQNDAIANLEGVRANATQTAQGIVNQGVQTAHGVIGSGRDFLSNLVSQLKGGNQATTGQTQTTTNESVAGSQSAGTATTEANTNQQQQNTVSSVDLLQIINQILAGNTSSQATEDSKSTTTKKSSGASLGL